MKNHPGTSLLTRPTLLYRVRDHSDGASWEEFHRLYHRLVFGRARRAGLSTADAEEVAQDVFKRVAETIGDFEHDPNKGSFRGWLMKLTHWRIADKYQSREKLPMEPPSASLDRVARQVKPRHFQVFELYVRQEWPVLKVSSRLGLNPATVYVIGHRLTKLLKGEVEKLRKQLG